jgi:aspartate aminotransferase-like enzyme
MRHAGLRHLAIEAALGSLARTSAAKFVVANGAYGDRAAQILNAPASPISNQRRQRFQPMKLQWTMPMRTGHQPCLDGACETSELNPIEEIAGRQAARQGPHGGCDVILRRLPILAQN